MTKYIMHGGFTKTGNELNKKFIKEIGRGSPVNFNLLLVFFAANKASYEQKYKVFSKILSNILKEKKPIFTLATEENFIEQIKKAQAIYLQGGDNLKLLKTINKFPEFKKLIKDKVVVGSSAGAYMLSKYFYGNDSDEVSKGLGILPIRTRCHYKGEIDKIIKNFFEFPDSLKYELVLLKDFEHKVYEI